MDAMNVQAGIEVNSAKQSSHSKLNKETLIQACIAKCNILKEEFEAEFKSKLHDAENDKCMGMDSCIVSGLDDCV
jgi:hypothetical protein